MVWLLHVLPERWLIYLCEQAKSRDAMIGGLKEGNQVYRISDKVVVKCGYDVSAGEAAIQKYANEHLDRRVVRVPRVYRYFQDRSDPSWPKGYLFMEYIPGKTLEESDLSTVGKISERLAHIVSNLAMVQGGDIPGPPVDGMFQGYLWGDNGTREIFSSVDDMNCWLNKRLKLIDKTIDLRPYPLVLCHLGLCRRNIKLMDDDNNTICLLDWGHAGFFPRFFEAAAASCMNDKNTTYTVSLREAMEETARLTVGEQECVNLLLKARAASLRYIL